MTPPPFLSSFPFGSFLVYPSPATTKDAQAAKTWILRLKEDRASAIPSLTLVEYTVRRVREHLANTSLGAILGDDVTFVPMPRSAPLVNKQAVWASRSIAEALVATHFGRDWQPLVERVRVCQKSATAAPGQRPTPYRHYETMRARPALIAAAPTSIVIVDDVVTAGSTFSGAAARLREIYPRVPIAAFALARTDRFVTIRVPCTGEIRTTPDGASSKCDVLRSP